MALKRSYPFRQTIRASKKRRYTRGKRYSRKCVCVSTRTGETKSVDTPVNDTVNVLTATTFGANHSTLNYIQQGTGSYQRIGRQITMKSVYGKLNFRLENTLAHLSQTVRLLLIYDRNANGALPLFSDILESKSSSGAVGTGYSSSMNLDNTHRFTILMDKLIDLNNYASTPYGYSGQIKSYNFYKKLNLKTLYQGPNADIGDIATGSLILCWGAKNSGISSPESEDAQINGTVRLRYTD